jgi:SAM-dependent methyltransferase
MTQHQHDHEHVTGDDDRYKQSYWDNRYLSRPSLWSGKPNPQLVAETGSLPAGRALDIGAGEGADAVWLAEQGWQVSALDLSTVALERAAAHAAERGPEVAGRIRWLHHNILEWEPPAASFDLVTCHFVQVPAGPREVLFDRMAAAVAPGGTLLVVGHHFSDLETTVPRPPQPELFYTGDDVARCLEPDEWEIVTNAAVPRSVTDPEGNAATVHDSVLRARRWVEAGG